MLTTSSLTISEYFPRERGCKEEEDHVNEDSVGKSDRWTRIGFVTLSKRKYSGVHVYSSVVLMDSREYQYGVGK